MSVRWFGRLDLAPVTHLLCDADGTLFPSEEPAYAASMNVTNSFLSELGESRTYNAVELQQMTNGKNFRGAAAELADRFDRRLDHIDLESWVIEEMEVVTAHLRDVLRPDSAVTEPVTLLSRHFNLAAVTSSAGPRLDVCLDVTALSALFPHDRRFSAETSLVRPVSKPDPAVYLHAAQRLGIEPDQGLAFEDSVNGARSAVAAGFPTVGIVQFIPVAQRADRLHDLAEVGAVAVVDDWSDLVTMLTPAQGRASRPH